MGKMIGFPDYNSAVVGQNGVIVKGDLTSLASITGAVATAIGSPSFSSSGYTGVQGAGTSTGIQIAIGAGDLANTALEWTITFNCSTSAFDHRFPPVVSENFIVITGGTTFILNRDLPAGDGVIKMFNNPNFMNGRFYTATDGWWSGNGEGRGPMSRVDLVGDSTGVDMYIDYHLYASSIWDGIGFKTTFTNLFLNSSGTSNGGTYTYNNLMISTNKMVIPKSTKGARIIWGVGDSYWAGVGAYPDRDGSLRQRCAFPGVGTGNPTPDGKSGTGYFGAPQGLSDSCTEAVIRRTLAQNGIYVPQFGMWAHGGAGYLVVGSDGVNKVQDRITTGLRLERPDVVVHMCGYNDATTNANTGPADLVAYRALVQAAIDAIIAKNPNVIIIICALPYKNDPTYYTAQLQSVINVNTQFQAVAAARPANVTFIDFFTLWGGANTTLDYFQVNDPHYTTKGAVSYGTEIAKVIIQKLLA